MKLSKIPCKVEWCNEQYTLAKKLCNRHYSMLKRSGEIKQTWFDRKPTIFDDRREYYFKDKVLIFDKDFEPEATPTVDHQDYVYINRVKAHRLVAKAPSGYQVDHINHNKLDNRKANLRVCSQRFNNFNRPLDKRNNSGYLGVYKSKQYNTYHAQVRKDRKVHYLGTFNTAIEAAKARDKKALELFGEWANLNFEVTA